MELKVCVYKQGPVMWELRRFSPLILWTVPKTLKLCHYIRNHCLAWRTRFEVLGFDFESHFKPSDNYARRASLALDPMFRQEYTVSTSFMFFLANVMTCASRNYKDKRAAHDLSVALFTKLVYPCAGARDMVLRNL